MADMDRVELLMGLSNNLRADNEEWRREVYREGQARAKRVLEMIGRFEAEYAALDRERQQLSQYIPRQQEKLPPVEPMPKAVTAGPNSGQGGRS